MQNWGAEGSFPDRTEGNAVSDSVHDCSALLFHSSFCILNLKQPDVKVEVKLVKNAEGQFRLDSPTY